MFDWYAWGLGLSIGLAMAGPASIWISRGKKTKTQESKS